MMKSISLVLGAVCVGTVVLAAQSLGDVAKKAEEERKTQKPASRVYTDKDLRDATAPLTQPLLVVTSAPIEQSESDRQDEYRRIARKDETYWKERMRSAQSALDGDRVFLAAAVVRESELKKRVRNESAVLYTRDRRVRAEIDAIDSQWETAVAEVSRLKAAVEIDRLAIVSLQEEARRANVPPGWLRP